MTIVPGFATVSYATTSRASAGAVATIIAAAAKAARPLCFSIPEVLSRTLTVRQCAGIRDVPVGEDGFQIVTGRQTCRRGESTVKIGPARWWKRPARDLASGQRVWNERRTSGMYSAWTSR